jgi:hypothetical protein
MKGMLRLALSSYIIIAVVGCTPAFALQERAMTPTRLATLSVASSERSARAGLERAPAPAVHPSAVRLPHASSAAAETLAVSVHGPSTLQSAAAPSFRASVGNASGSHYYYWWFAANCARRIGCAPSSYALVAEGVDRDSVALAVGASSAEKNLVVQVAEIDGTGRTGSSPMFVVIGPAQKMAAGRPATAKATCDWFAGSFYPHSGDYTDPYSGRTWTRKFRRDYCGNRVQWDPEG